MSGCVFIFRIFKFYKSLKINYRITMIKNTFTLAKLPVETSDKFTKLIMNCCTFF